MALSVYYRFTSLTVPFVSFVPLLHIWMNECISGMALLLKMYILANAPALALAPAPPGPAAASVQMKEQNNDGYWYDIKYRNQ